MRKLVKACERMILMDYFYSMVASVTNEELFVLDALSKSESLQGYSSRSKEFILEKTELTEFQLRKALSNLERMQFINRISSYRKHTYFISQYGIQAINTIASEEGTV